jgi:hypothetical protein
MVGYSTLEASKALAVALCSLSHRTQKLNPIKKNPIAHSDSRHTLAMWVDI